MGAIYGFCGAQLEETKRTAMLERNANLLSFRGRSKSGFQDETVALGAVKHGYEKDNRVILNKELSIVVICEGEIYNKNELLNMLKQPPASGAELSAFELLPYLYRELGRDFTRKVNGVFCIALWDQTNRKLLLVRDHLGSHSVFYFLHKDVFYFGTTISSIFTMAPVPQKISADSLDRYFASLAISPPDSIFEKVMAVRPGYMVIFDNGDVSEYPYWPIHTIQEMRNRSFHDFAGQIGELFVDAVSLRAAAGGNSGALVSGGVDTSAVLAALKKTGNIEGIQGFSVAFAEQEFNDAPLQEIIYNFCGMKKNTIILSPSEFSQGLIQGSAFLDSPVNDTAFSGMFTAFKAASKKGCNVVYEGEGSDEFFCTGHSRGEFDIQKFLCLPFPLRRLLFGAFIPRFSEGASFMDKAVRMLARIGMSDLQRRSIWIPGFSQNTRNRLLGRRACHISDIYGSAGDFYGETCLQDMINIYQYGLTRLFLPDDLLFKNERMASAAGITNRTPFVDYRLVEAAFQVPAEYKMKKPSAESDGTKLIFKAAARGLVPDAILDRKKTRGFSQPTAVWYHGELKGFVLDHLLDRNAKIGNWLDRGEVKRICSDFMDGRISNDYFINSLLILELWLRSHL